MIFIGANDTTRTDLIYATRVAEFFQDKRSKRFFVGNHYTELPKTPLKNWILKDTWTIVNDVTSLVNNYRYIRYSS